MAEHYYHTLPPRVNHTLPPLIRHWAPRAVYPKMNQATGLLDLTTYPDLSRVGTFVRNATAVLEGLSIVEGEPWAAVVQRAVAELVPADIVGGTAVALLVLCFDDARPHAMRTRAPPAVPPDAPWPPCFATGRVAPYVYMHTVLHFPPACELLYAALWRELAHRAPLAAGVRIVLDGLHAHADDSAPAVLTVGDGARLRCSVRDVRTSGIALATWPRDVGDAADRLALWTELCTAGSDVLVEHGAPEALIKLLARAEIAPPERRVLAVHRRSGGLVTRDGGACVSSIVSEPHEYIDVALAARQLRRVYAGVLAPMVVASGGRARASASRLDDDNDDDDDDCDGDGDGDSDSSGSAHMPTPVMPVLALVLLAFHVPGMPLRVSTCAQSLAVCAQNADSYCRGLLRVRVRGSGLMTTADVTVCHEPLERLHAALVAAGSGGHDRYAVAALGARAALLLHRLYNSHVPGQRVDAAVVRARDPARPGMLAYGFVQGKDGAPALAAGLVAPRETYAYSTGWAWAQHGVAKSKAQ